MAGASEAEISSYEAQLGYHIPPLLREWIGICHADMVGPGGRSSVDPFDGEFNIIQRSTLQPTWKDLGWFPVGGDWCGNYYVVACKGEPHLTEPVYFIDSSDDLDEPTYIAASDIRFFLKGLLLADLGDIAWHWPFDQLKALEFDPDIARSNAKMPWDA